MVIVDHTQFNTENNENLQATTAMQMGARMVFRLEEASSFFS